MLSRSTSTLVLSRVACWDIKRIEIVKGPSSSLYGSEALAGVINIITRDPEIGARGTLSARYGSNQTSDLGASLGGRGEKLSVYGFLNRYSTEGYRLRSEEHTSELQ